MSTYATIHSTDDEPISKEFLIVSDDDFEVVEEAAKDKAAGGVKCCIRWQRSEDGQAAYWGPRGACFSPHWYSKPGRPEEMQGGKRRNVYIDDASWAKAVELGNGNASDGIRVALAKS
jgi:hypothetical protein